MAQPDQRDTVVIRVPAADTRAKMFTALRELQHERDDARNEAALYRALLEQVDAHYSGSLDHQPGYVRAIRSALDEERAPA